MKPRVAKGRADWIILTSKYLVARSNLSENERKAARASNIEVQGLKNEVQQLRQELQSMRNPNQRYFNPNQQYRYNSQPYSYQQPYNNISKDILTAQAKMINAQRDVEIAQLKGLAEQNRKKTYVQTYNKL